MKINDVLHRKGTGVATVRGSSEIAAVVDELARRDIGALVVVDDTGIVGIISERDVVRQLQLRGAEVLQVRVDEIMSRAVSTCSSDDTIPAAMRTMTDQRVRHLPVVDGDRLVGIVSIGDVVKSRIDELEATTDQLENYIVGGGR
jgi:CBS domain-containing protein